MHFPFLLYSTVCFLFSFDILVFGADFADEHLLLFISYRLRTLSLITDIALLVISEPSSF